MRSKWLTNILEIGTIINLDRVIDVSFVLEENKFFFFSGYQWRKWGLIVDDTTCHFVGHLREFGSSDVLLSPKLDKLPSGTFSLIALPISLVISLPLGDQIWYEGVIKLAFEHTGLVLSIIDLVHDLGILQTR